MQNDCKRKKGFVIKAGSKFKHLLYNKHTTINKKKKLLKSYVSSILLHTSNLLILTNKMQKLWAFFNNKLSAERLFWMSNDQLFWKIMKFTSKQNYYYNNLKCHTIVTYRHLKWSRKVQYALEEFKRPG